MIRRPPRSTRVRSSAASDVYKRQTTYKPRWIHTKRIRTSLLWLHAFFSSLTGNLVRRYPFVGRSVHRFTIVTDASPWGIGGVLYLKSAAVAYFSDKLHLCDLNRFRARIGESAFTTVWESLAILVALRLWRPLFTYADAVGVRSDSHGSLSALASLSTSSASLNLIAVSYTHLTLPTILRV